MPSTKWFGPTAPDTGSCASDSGDAPVVHTVRMSRVRLLPASAAMLVVIATLAYRMRRRSFGQRPGVTGPTTPTDPLENPPPRPLPDFVEIGPDLFKKTGACSEAELASAIRRLRREAASLGAQAATARRDGDEQAEGQLMGRALVIAGDAQAFERYVDSRRRSSV